MQVIATAGHSDHGKSTLVEALTGMDPARGESGPGRGLTADLGHAWLTLPSGEQLAFADVPGHERFIANALAGIGPVPAVLFVVAADDGWRPQSAEHLAAIDALGIRRGLLVVTKIDLADPGPVLAEAAPLIAASSLGEVESLAVSAVTGEGLPGLVEALGRLAGSLPVRDPGAPVRIWVERAFGTAGSGTVVTGTLPSGTVRSGDELVITPAMRPVRVRGIQALGEPVTELAGPAWAAFSLCGASHERIARGMALLHPGRWTLTDIIDVRLTTPGSPASAGSGAGAAAGAGTGASAGAGTAVRLPRTLAVHIGTARTVARVRVLGDRIARLVLREPLPLHVGDRLLLRDPGPSRAAPRSAGADGAARPRPPGPGAVMHGAVVLDVAPPSLSRRGAGASAAAELGSWPDRPDAAYLLRRHGLLRASALLAMGISDHPDPVSGEWLADPGHWAELAGRLGEAATAQVGQEPLTPGLPLEAARAALSLPDRRLVEALVKPPLRIRDGLILITAADGARGATAELPASVTAAVQVLLADLATAPFASPDADRLRHLGLDLRAIAAAERAGLLMRVSDQIVLAPGADALAGRVLAGLPQPFTAAEARQALQTTRRVAIPLLEFLDRAGVTQRLPDDRRLLVSRPAD
jgi:selenocysteine-specific elongation factor